MSASKIILISIAAMFGLFTLGLVFRGCNHISDSVENAVVNYEQYQDIYNTCEKLNTDLCNMKALPDSDAMFQQFSKAQRINTIRTNLNRWVEEYNAKSRMINRSIWKSGKLPYQLNVSQYACY